MCTLVFPDGNFFIFFNRSNNHASCCSQMVKGVSVMKKSSTVVCRMWCQCYREVAVLELSQSSCARIFPNCWLQNFNCFHLSFCFASGIPCCWLKIFLSVFSCGFPLPVSCLLELVSSVSFAFLLVQCAVYDCGNLTPCQIWHSR